MTESSHRESTAKPFELTMKAMLNPAGSKELLDAAWFEPR
jgi:hypothetical protein